HDFCPTRIAFLFAKEFLQGLEAVDPGDVRVSPRARFLEKAGLDVLEQGGDAGDAFVPARRSESRLCVFAPELVAPQLADFARLHVTAADFKNDGRPLADP